MPSGMHGRTGHEQEELAAAATPCQEEKAPVVQSIVLSPCELDGDTLDDYEIEYFHALAPVDCTAADSSDFYSCDEGLEEAEDEWGTGSVSPSINPADHAMRLSIVHRHSLLLSRCLACWKSSSAARRKLARRKLSKRTKKAQNALAMKRETAAMLLASADAHGRFLIQRTFDHWTCGLEKWVDIRGQNHLFQYWLKFTHKVFCLWAWTSVSGTACGDSDVPYETLD